MAIDLPQHNASEIPRGEVGATTNCDSDPRFILVSLEPLGSSETTYPAIERCIHPKERKRAD
jgi:hypothetical protein